MASDRIVATLVCAPAVADKPRAFALTLVPPAVDESRRPHPRDIVVVLDRSGSMQGWKMVAARRAVGRLVDTLLDQDRFTVLAFDDTIEYPGHATGMLVGASNRDRWRALEWLGKIDARGGTEMGPALQQAVKLLATDAADRQRIVVLITDGQIAGEDAVLRTLKKLGGSDMPRIHALGIDQAVNEGFLQRLAKMGKGTCDLVESEDRLDDAMNHIHRAIGDAALTQLRLESVGGRLEPDSVVPSPLPDLFADRPVTVFGRVEGDVSSIQVRVRGVDGAGLPWQQQVAVCPRTASSVNSLWGRAKVRELEDRYAAGGVRDAAALERRIVQISLESHVLSRFTAYVAVDGSEIVNPGGRPHAIIQPVEMPAGWDMSCDLMASPAALGAVCMCLESPAPSPRQILHRKRRSRSREALVAYINDAEELLMTIGQFRSMKLETLIGHIELLLGTLHDLLSELDPKNRSASEEVEELIKRGKSIIDDASARQQDAVDEARLLPFLAAVQQMLESLKGSPDRVADRKSFWK